MGSHFALLRCLCYAQQKSPWTQILGITLALSSQIKVNYNLILQGSSDKLNGQLKMHLDSIFDGFQKLISGSDESQERRQLPFVIEKTIHNILFIKTHMQRQDEFDAVSCFCLIISSTPPTPPLLSFSRV